MKIFPTAQDAENAFYEALERADLDAMMAVWAEDEEIVCVHPGGPRLVGQEQVRESWAKIFSGGPQARVHVSQQVTVAGMMIAVHSVVESFTLLAERGDMRPLPAVATNVYLRAGAGWRLVVHHASPAPPAAKSAEPPREPGPKILH
jgi:uncharacterized protein (TIGR02246 family)